MLPVYVIHLPNPDRKARISAELDKAGFTDVQFVHAQEPFEGFTCNNMRRNPRGEFGCALSHIKAISEAICDRATEALFVEDDVVFEPGALGRLEAALDRLRTFSSVLYLGGHPREPVQPTEIAGVVKVGLWSCAEAYYMHEMSMPSFLTFWANRAGQKNAMYDFILGEFAAQLDSYAFCPPLTHQPPGWSHIGQKHDDKTALIEKGWRENLAA